MKQIRNILIAIILILLGVFILGECTDNDNLERYNKEYIDIEIDSLKDIKSNINIEPYIASIDSLKESKRIVHEDIDSTQMGSYIQNEAIINTLNIIEYQDTLIDSLIYIKRIDSTIIHNLEIKEIVYENELKESKKRNKRLKRNNIYIIISATLLAIGTIIHIK